MTSRAKHWCFTLNAAHGDPTDWYGHLTYCIHQKEQGSTNTAYIHWQGYLVLRIKRDIKWLKRHIHATAHWEQIRGTSAQNIEYCSKSSTKIGETIEHGERPVERGHRSDLDAVAALVRDGGDMKEVADLHPTTFIRNYRGIYEYRNVIMPIPDEKPIVYLYYGDPNTGKSWAGRELGSYYTVPVEDSRPWFNGYTGQDVMMMDEFTGQFSINWMKTFLEDRACQLPTKGGYVANRAKYIVLTSNHHPLKWWPNVQTIDLLALYRRFDVILHWSGTSFANAICKKVTSDQLLNSFFD